MLNHKKKYGRKIHDSNEWKWLKMMTNDSEAMNEENDEEWFENQKRLRISRMTNDDQKSLVVHSMKLSNTEKTLKITKV